MIGRLRGILVEQDETRLVVECAGVGYEVWVSTNTLVSLPPAGEEVTLRVFTHMMETRITLYGFGSLLERDLFDLLITVKKIGPATAMSILSTGAAPLDIARMIAGAEIGMLTKLRGVGRKTAEMLVVELREKCEMLVLTAAAREPGAARLGPAVIPPAPSGRLPILDEVAAALVQLGWRTAEADKAVSALEVDEGATIETLLRKALRSMPR